MDRYHAIETDGEDRWEIDLDGKITIADVQRHPEETGQDEGQLGLIVR